MHVVVVVEGLQKRADFRPLLLAEIRKLFGHIAQFARHHGPSVFREPFRNGVRVRPVGDEPRARGARRAVVPACRAGWFVSFLPFVKISLFIHARGVEVTELPGVASFSGSTAVSLSNW